MLCLRCLTVNTVTGKKRRELPEYSCLSLVNSLGFNMGGYVTCRMSSAKEQLHWQDPALPHFSGYLELHIFNV